MPESFTFESFEMLLTLQEAFDEAHFWAYVSAFWHTYHEFREKR